MCGIFGILNPGSLSLDDILKQYMKGEKRGPESHKYIQKNTEFIGFHRLAINGLDEKSNQPLQIGNVTLICNGEIYNYKQLFKDLKVTPTTNSDCEVIAHLYIKYGMEYTLQLLDGVFSFALFDYPHCFVARDSIGIRPLYFVESIDEQKNYHYYFASELKCVYQFHKMHKSLNHTLTYGQFKPGTYKTWTEYNDKWCFVKEKTYFKLIHSPPLSLFPFSGSINVQYNVVYSRIEQLLTAAVRKRCDSTDRPIACLLSGGLDSSLITSLVQEHYQRDNMLLETYSIGLEGSEDLKNATIVAKYLGTNHTEITVTEELMVETIPEVIRAIESYDVTTVRASIGNYLLGKYISQHSNAKVIFNGDGSDELFGGYLYMDNCEDSTEFDIETRRLLKYIHTFDVLRSDKCISSHGLEPRTPFLDKHLVNAYLSIPKDIRYSIHKLGGKHVVRNGFCPSRRISEKHNQGLLPDVILWRKKEAFSDGVSQMGRSLFTIIQEHIAKKPQYAQYKGVELEKRYYKDVFENTYANMEKVLPFYWMPKYTLTDDPSARTLEHYSSSDNRH